MVLLTPAALGLDGTACTPQKCPLAQLQLDTRQALGMNGGQAKVAVRADGARHFSRSWEWHLLQDT